MIVPLALGALGGIVLASLPKWRDWRLTKAMPIEISPSLRNEWFTTTKPGDIGLVMLANTVTGEVRPAVVRFITSNEVLGTDPRARWTAQFVFAPEKPAGLNPSTEPFLAWEAWMPKPGETAEIAVDHVLLNPSLLK